jgi:hypothetical protein
MPLILEADISKPNRLRQAFPVINEAAPIEIQLDGAFVTRPLLLIEMLTREFPLFYLSVHIHYSAKP